MKPKTDVLLMLSGLLVALFFAGCAFIEAVPDNSLSRLIVQNRTLAFIDASPAKAERVQEAAQAGLDLLADDPDVRMTRLKAAVDRWVPWERLSPTDEMQLRALIQVIQDGVNEARRERGGDVLTEAQRVKLRTLLQWIIEAAELVP